MYNDKFEILQTSTKFIRKYNAHMHVYNVKFNNIPEDFLGTIQFVNEIMEEILYKFKENLEIYDRIKIYISHPELTHPISLPFMRVEDLTAEMIVVQIVKVLQSNKKLALDDKLTFSTSVLKLNTGCGSTRLDEYIIKKQSIVKVKEEADSVCALRAIILGMVYATPHEYTHTYAQISNRKNNFQTREAYLLANQLGFDINKPIGLDEIQQVEKYLQNYQIFVIDAACLHNIVYIGPPREYKICLYLKDYTITWLNPYRHFIVRKTFVLNVFYRIHRNMLTINVIKYAKNVKTNYAILPAY